MGLFTVKKPKPELVRFVVGYACAVEHCHYKWNEGICFFCGEPVEKAVCRGEYYPHVGGWYPKRDGFVRWLK